MMNEIDHNDDEIVSLLEEEEKGDQRKWANRVDCIRSKFIAPKLFYFFFFSAQGSLVPYLALYYKQLRLTAAEAGLVSGAKMYVAFFIIPFWSMLVDKFKVGKIVFIMSTSALMATMLTISMAPANICAVRDGKTRRNIFGIDISEPNDNLSSNYYASQPSYKLPHILPKYEDKLPNIDAKSVGFASETGSFTHHNLFLFLFLVTVFGTIFSCPSLSLADSATVDLLARNSETYKYGQQRLWGSIGNGIAAFVVGSSISQTNLCAGEPRQVNYYWCFYIFAVFLFLSIIAGSRLEFNSRDLIKESSGVCSSLGRVLANGKYFVFLFTVFFDGVAMSFIKAFLFWFLKDLGGSQLLFSVITAVNSCAEVLMYFFSAYIIKRLGSIRVLCIGLICYSVRFLFYAFTVKPWLVLVVEPLSGVTTAAVWAAIMSHVGVTSDKDSAVTLQGVIHCIHWGLGHGSGSVIGGVLVHNVGCRMTFALFAIISLINVLVYALVLSYKRAKKGQMQGQDK